MSISAVIIATCVVAGVGLIVGILLGVVGKVFEVEVNEKEVQIRELLPGNNCGGCGYPGCDGLAAAIAKGEAPASGCPVGGAAVAAEIAKITGGEVDETRYVAFVHCNGTSENSGQKYIYSGNMTCREAATMVGGGSKACSYGCLGYGSCVDACQFDAIKIVNGVSVVDKEACKGCGACAKACPRHLIDLVPYEAKVLVRCSSKDKGKDVMNVCKVGCIGCSMCAKLSGGPIEMNGNIPAVNYEGEIPDDKIEMITTKCPKKCIIKG